jgi:hypothetical protein
MSGLATLIALALVHTDLAYAQSDQKAEDAALVAAERALLEGLSSKAPGAFEQVASAPAQQPELKPATYQAPIIKPERAQPDIQVGMGQNTGSIVQEPATKELTSAPLVEERQQAPAATAAPAIPNVNVTLKRELDAKQRRIADLERQLEEVRGQLTMAETELSRLATISEARNRASLGRAALPASVHSGIAPAQTAAKAHLPAPHIEPTPASSADLTIATVDVEKAELRLGPGKNHSPLMTVAKGSRLAVEARQGEWLRVFAPNGQRAWVQTKLVTFGSKPHANSASTTVRVRGYSSALEDEAFKRVQSLTAGR